MQVVKQEGWERLYGGLAPSLVGTAASQVSFFILILLFFSSSLFLGSVVLA